METVTTTSIVITRITRRVSKQVEINALLVIHLKNSNAGR